MQEPAQHVRRALERGACVIMASPGAAGRQARTVALRQVLEARPDPAFADDLLFLEDWELAPQPGAAAALRIAQLRRANPGLAAAIRAELSELGRASRATLVARATRQV